MYWVALWCIHINQHDVQAHEETPFRLNHCFESQAVIELPLILVIHRPILHPMKVAK